MKSVVGEAFSAWSQVKRSIFVTETTRLNVLLSTSQIYFEKGSAQLPYLGAQCQFNAAWSYQITQSSKKIFQFFTTLSCIPSLITDEYKSLSHKGDARLQRLLECTVDVVGHWFSRSVMTRSNNDMNTVSGIERTDSYLVSLKIYPASWKPWKQLCTVVHLT